jgi:hypothetical protein
MEGWIRLWVTEKERLILDLGLGDFLLDGRLIQRWVVACEFGGFGIVEI